MDREGRTIIISFTTMDLHDIARPVRAYEINTFYISPAGRCPKGYDKKTDRVLVP
jgi:hypothetical protein